VPHVGEWRPGREPISYCQVLGQEFEQSESASAYFESLQRPSPLRKQRNNTEIAAMPLLFSCKPNPWRVYPSKLFPDNAARMQRSLSRYVSTPVCFPSNPMWMNRVCIWKC
jgi:hypothetical protein